MGSRLVRVFGSLTLALVMILALGAMYLYRDLNSRLEVNTGLDDVASRAPKESVAGEALNILVMGDDSRAGAGNDIDGESGGGSDTTLLLHLSGDRKRAYGISIPRDTMVSKPECPANGTHQASAARSSSQWNSAYGIGGPVCTVAQFEENTKVHVDDFAVVDFNGFKAMVDAIGGVTMCVPFDLTDSEYVRTTIKAGKNRRLDGEEARAYVRMRKIEALPSATRGSDLSRTRRQQEFLGAMAKQVLNAGTLSNPVTVTKFLQSVMGSLTVSEGLGNVTKLGQLGAKFQGIGLDDIQFITIPVVDWPQDRNRVMFAQPAADDIWRAIRKDRKIPDRLLTGVLRADGKSGVPAEKADAASASPSAGASDTSESPGSEPSSTGSPSSAASSTAEPSTPRSTKPAIPASVYDDRAANGLC